MVTAIMMLLVAAVAAAVSVVTTTSAYHCFEPGAIRKEELRARQPHPGFPRLLRTSGKKGGLHETAPRGLLSMNVHSPRGPKKTRPHRGAFFPATSLGFFRDSRGTAK